MPAPNKKKGHSTLPKDSRREVSDDDDAIRHVSKRSNNATQGKTKNPKDNELVSIGGKPKTPPKPTKVQQKQQVEPVLKKSVPKKEETKVVESIKSAPSTKTNARTANQTKPAPTVVKEPTKAAIVAKKGKVTPPPVETSSEEEEEDGDDYVDQFPDDSSDEDFEDDFEGEFDMMNMFSPDLIAKMFGGLGESEADSLLSRLFGGYGEGHEGEEGDGFDYNGDEQQFDPEIFKAIAKQAVDKALFGPNSNALEKLKRQLAEADGEGEEGQEGDLFGGDYFFGEGEEGDYYFGEGEEGDFDDNSDEEDAERSENDDLDELLSLQAIPKTQNTKQTKKEATKQSSKHPKQMDDNGNDGDGDEDDDDDDDDDDIQAEFNFHDPDNDKDWHAVKRFVANLIDKKDFNASEFADLITLQQQVGTTIKCPDAGEEPLGFISLLGFNQHAEKQSMKQIKDYIINNSGNEKNKKQLQQLFATQSVGLLVTDRLVNLPMEVVPALYNELLKDVQFAKKETQQQKGKVGKNEQNWQFQYYVLISQASDAVTTGVKGSKHKDKGNADANGLGEVWYTRFEDEFFAKRAQVIKKVTTSQTKPWLETGKLPLHNIVMVLPAHALSEVRDELTQLIGIGGDEKLF